MGTLQLKDQCLMGIYTWGEIVFGLPNLHGWFHRLCTGAASTMLKICLGWCGASSVMVSGFYSLGNLLTILSASEDSRSLMGGSDVVHCIWVPLIGTTMAVFATCRSVVGIVFCILYLLCVQYCGLLGAPLSLYCNGPTSWQCSQAYMFDPMSVHVIISFGDCSVSLFCLIYWAVPHHLAGAQQSVCTRTFVSDTCINRR